MTHNKGIKVPDGGKTLLTEVLSGNEWNRMERNRKEGLYEDWNGI